MTVHQLQPKGFRGSALNPGHRSAGLGGGGRALRSSPGGIRSEQYAGHGIQGPFAPAGHRVWGKPETPCTPRDPEASVRVGLNGPTENTDGAPHGVAGSGCLRALPAQQLLFLLPLLKLGLPVGAGPPPRSVLVATGADGGCVHQRGGEKALESRADTEGTRRARGSEVLGTPLSAWIQLGLKPNTSGI